MILADEWGVASYLEVHLEDHKLERYLVSLGLHVYIFICCLMAEVRTGANLEPRVSQN